MFGSRTTRASAMTSGPVIAMARIQAITTRVTCGRHGRRETNPAAAINTMASSANVN